MNGVFRYSRFDQLLIFDLLEIRFVYVAVVQNFGELGYAGFFLFMSLLWFTYKGTYLVAEKLSVSGNLKSYARMCSIILVMYCAATFFVTMELDLFYFNALNVERREPDFEAQFCLGTCRCAETHLECYHAVGT